jgi:hypothetical protein
MLLVDAESEEELYEIVEAYPFGSRWRLRACRSLRNW